VGAAELIEGDSRVVEAVVRGTDEYAVSLTWSPKGRLLEGNCTCPYFDDRLAICKHIWATVLAAEEGGFLSSIRSLARVQLVPGFEPPSDSWELLARASARLGPIEPSVPAWRSRLREVKSPSPSLPPNQRIWIEGRQILYQLDVEASRRDGAVTLELRSRDRKKNGAWGALKTATPLRRTISHLPQEADRHLLSMILGGREAVAAGWRGALDELPKRFVLPGEILPAWMQQAAQTGRLVLPVTGAKPPSVLAWDDGEPWRFELEVTSAKASNGGRDGDELRLTGQLRRNADRVVLREPVLLSAAGLVFFQDRVARLDIGEAFSWVPLLRREEEIRVPAGQATQFIEALLGLPRPPVVHLPEELRYEEIQGELQPRLTVNGTTDPWLQRNYLLAVVLDFDYQGASLTWGDERRGIYTSNPARFLRRDPAAEEGALRRLRELGVREEPSHHPSKPEPRLLLPEGRLPELVHRLTLEGWRVEAEGRRYRQAGPLDLEVTSGIDWFDLQGTATFGDQEVELPRLLQSLERGEKSILLDDGSLGVLPEEWLERLRPLAEMGELSAERLRFLPSQIGLLDALLAARPEIGFDQAVDRARKQLADFSGVKARSAPRTFKGTLRDYQKEGLGWLHFLRRFGFGGCLADDMGLGKTVQVLALLESRRQLRHSKAVSADQRPAPTLVVMPRSLIFNWRNEAARFTPRLRLLEHVGPRRPRDHEGVEDHDVVLTTYGTLRRDIALLKEVEFDYVVLDEAQAIKNHKSATAKASRLLRSRHRLALTGTPIENHAGELMSILDFLNPGLFGSSRGLTPLNAVREGTLGEDGLPNPQLSLIVGAVRPFVLRRTKRQVAKELPDKVEQTLYCELLPQQRREYDELRLHYQRELLGTGENRGQAGSQIRVLEALLRLRQAACHPGLIDPARGEDESGKLALLLPQLEELVEGGHKSLVFSQFTSMLAIVRKQLDARGIPYEYLDGQTRKREPRIRRFQEDPTCPIFLISLKAGGLGLNLTAAEYVFLLDPWWNPAVEAQAIDRSHRIGQTRTVFAYSLIARDTVEEKVLELQKSKRQLADAIIQADTSLLRNLTREELSELLS